MPQMASYLRSHRKRSGLTQGDVASILGSLSRDQVSRHEWPKAIPTLIAAVGYQTLFLESISGLFPGIVEAVSVGIEDRLSDLEKQLQQSKARGRRGAEVARKLEWFAERRMLKDARMRHEENFR